MKNYTTIEVSEHNITAAPRTQADIEEFNNAMAEAMLRISESKAKECYFQELIPIKSE